MRSSLPSCAQHGTLPRFTFRQPGEASTHQILGKFNGAVVVAVHRGDGANGHPLNSRCGHREERPADHILDRARDPHRVHCMCGPACICRDWCPKFQWYAHRRDHRAGDEGVHREDNQRGHRA